MERKRSFYQLFCNCSGIPRKRPGDCCLRITNAPFHRPDLALYSQAEEVYFGRQPTWNNPDITTNDWWPFRLMESVEVRVSNRSTKANAGNALINLFVGPFGIGMPLSLYASRKTTVIHGNSVNLQFPLDSSLRAEESQRFSFMVKAEHPYDTELINNQGSQTIDGRQTSLAGRHFTVDVPVRNPHSDVSRRIELQVIPGALIASINWDHHEFAPLEERVVRLDVTVPAGLRETEDSSNKYPVTVIATYNGGMLLGGATVITRIDS